MKRPKFRRTERFSIDEIVVAERHRKVNNEKVAVLAQSIGEIGLMHPPTVRYVDEEIDGAALLVSGRHRLEALRSRGETDVDCFVVDMNDLQAELAEIDENLMRENLSPAQEAQHIKRRKELYEAMHPTTKHGGAPSAGIGKGKRKDAADGAFPQDSFAQATAKATGKSKRSIQKQATIAKRIDPDLLDKVEGTSLDKPTELEALAKKTPEQQQQLVEDAAAGKVVSAKETKPPKPPPPTKLEKAVAAFNDLSVSEQFQFGTWVIEQMKTRVVSK